MQSSFLFNCNFTQDYFYINFFKIKESEVNAESLHTERKAEDHGKNDEYNPKIAK